MKDKFRAFVAGYGSGKTWVGCMAQCQHFIEHPKINQAYYAPTFPHIRDIYYPTIEEVAHDFGIKLKIKTSDKEVTFMRGRKYLGTTICRSMDRPENIIGYKSGKALVDEIDILPIDKAKLAWRKIIARMRYKVDGLKNGVDVTTTPEGFKFVYQQFKQNKVNGYGLIQASTYDNESNLPDDYIQSLLDSYPDELISAYLNGQFVNLTSGTVFSSYDRNLNRTLETVKEKEPIRIGMDFNIANMSAVVYVVRGKEWHAVDEIKEVYDTHSMINIINEKYREHSIRVYPDATGARRDTRSGAGGASKSDIALLESAGFSIYANKTNPLVKDRVISTNIAFQKGLLYINDLRCPEFSKCMEQLAYDKNGVPDKSSNLDHLPDAGTYPIAFEMPIDRPQSIIKMRFAR